MHDMRASNIEIDTQITGIHKKFNISDFFEGKKLHWSLNLRREIKWINIFKFKCKVKVKYKIKENDVILRSRRHRYL